MQATRARDFAGVLSTFLGLACIVATFTDSCWKPLLHPLVFDLQGNYHPHSFTSAAAKFTFHHLSDWMMMGMLGGLLTMLGIVTLFRGRFSWSQKLPTLIVLSAGILLTMLTVLVTAPLFMVEPGVEIRPMAWSFAIFLLTAIGFAFATTAGVMALTGDDSRFPPVAGTLLCLAPLPLSLLLFVLAQRMQGWIDIL